MNRAQLDKLADAVREDHPCKDTTGCDIAVALENGFTEAAAWLLSSATETPAIAATGLSIGHFFETSGFTKWADFYRANSRKCPACESHMFADEYPVKCTNCLATVN